MLLYLRFSDHPAIDADPFPEAGNVRGSVESDFKPCSLICRCDFCCDRAFAVCACDVDGRKGLRGVIHKAVQLLGVLQTQFDAVLDVS